MDLDFQDDQRNRADDKARGDRVACDIGDQQQVGNRKQEIDRDGDPQPFSRRFPAGRFAFLAIK
ncbi:hypothetical protein D9M69_649160 [compost metagenome]